MLRFTKKRHFLASLKIKPALLFNSQRQNASKSTEYAAALVRLMEGSANTELLKCRKSLSDLQKREGVDICLTDLTNKDILKSTNVRTSPIRNLLSQELIASVSPELAFNSYLQYTKFADTLYRFGTARQQKGLIGELLDECREVGCVALFEAGSDKTGVHQLGRNNAKGENPIKTRAVYNPETEKFMLNTGNSENDKIFVEHGHTASYCIVFADLIVKTGSIEKQEGVHGFLVSLKQADLSLRPGVQIFECPNPASANGLSWLPHSRLRFTDVELSRSEFLESQCIFRKTGKYSSLLKKHLVTSGSHRATEFRLRNDEIMWGTMQLLSSYRHSMSTMALGACKQVLNVAFEACKTESDKFNFMPILARTIVLNYALVAARECWVGTYGREDLAVPLSYGLKTVICEHFREVVRLTTEICGNDSVSDTYQINLVEMASFANHLANSEGPSTTLLHYCTAEYAPLYTGCSLYLLNLLIFLGVENGSLNEVSSPKMQQHTTVSKKMKNTENLKLLFFSSALAELTRNS